VREGLSLCAHLAALAPGPAPFALPPDEILDYDDAPVVAVVRCTACGGCGWLALIEWDPSRGAPRVYALAAIRAADVALYFRNRARGSCDAARSAAELAALEASAGPFERIVALEHRPEPVVVAVAAAEPGFAPPGPRQHGPWFARFGLARGAAR
jgi:hypothetical protein